MITEIFHPQLALIASASNNELARDVEFLKEENKILQARISGQIHAKPDEQSRLVKLGKALRHAIEELITLVAPSTFYRWCREELSRKSKKNLIGVGGLVQSFERKTARRRVYTDGCRDEHGHPVTVICLKPSRDASLVGQRRSLETNLVAMEQPLPSSVRPSRKVDREVGGTCHER